MLQWSTVYDGLRLIIIGAFGILEWSSFPILDWEKNKSKGIWYFSNVLQKSKSFALKVSRLKAKIQHYLCACFGVLRNWITNMLNYHILKTFKWKSTKTKQLEVKK